ncbi:hypothetical protein V1283_004192 [Bradyrhizobium sp. AZCC 2262]
MDDKRVWKEKRFNGSHFQERTDKTALEGQLPDTEIT